MTSKTDVSELGHVKYIADLRECDLEKVELSRYGQQRITYR